MKTCGDCKASKSLEEFYNVASSPDGKHRYCKQCCKVHRAQARVHKRDKKKGVSNRQQYRARVEHGHTEVDTISLAKLYRRDKGICALCLLYVESNLASIDHIIPLMRGGKHVWSNVQLAHIKCNKKKGVRAR